jgi:predicted transcriptional regulator
VTGIRTLAVDSHNTLYGGTVNNGIWCTELAVGLSPLLDVGIKLKTLVEVLKKILP